MASEKKYIGGGKATKWDGVSVTIRMEDAEKFIREYESGKYLSFIVSPRKTASDKGQTHTAFVLVDAEAPETAKVPEPAMAAEPETVMVKGRKMRKISKAEADKLRAAQAA